MTIDIGSGDLWAGRRGIDECYRRLVRYKGNLTMAQFTLVLNKLEEAVTDRELHARLRSEFAILKSIPPAVVRYILNHPAWIYWARSTHEAINAYQSGSELDSYWRGHFNCYNTSSDIYLTQTLAHFSQLVAAACVLAGQEIEMTLKLADTPFLSLAGTGFSYVLPEHLRKDGVVLCRVRKTSDQAYCLYISGVGESDATQFDYSVQGVEMFPATPSIHWLPRISRYGNSIEIDNRDSRIVKNWVSADILQQPDVRPAADADIPAWGKHIQEAMDLLQVTCSPMDQEVFYIIRTLIPVISGQQDRNVSVSSRDYWGAILCSWHPYILQADVIAHEYRHNILNAILDAQPVLDTSNPSEAFLYSPWRMDKRPLNGVLHAIYAFTEVVGFHFSYLEKCQPTANLAELAERQILTNVYRLQIAQEVFEKHACLTPFGSQLVEGLHQRIQGFADKAAQLNTNKAEEARRQVQQHRIAWMTVNENTA